MDANSDHSWSAVKPVQPGLPWKQSLALISIITILVFLPRALAEKAYWSLTSLFMRLWMMLCILLHFVSRIVGYEGIGKIAEWRFANGSQRNINTHRRALTRPQRANCYSEMSKIVVLPSRRTDFYLFGNCSLPNGLRIKQQKEHLFRGLNWYILQLQTASEVRKTLHLPCTLCNTRSANEDFCDRPCVLERLAAELLPWKHRVAVSGTTLRQSALCGLGGIGKIEIAREFSQRHKNSFDAVF